VKVEFELVSPSEPYFHIVKTLLNQYLDGVEQEHLDLSGMADNIVERASIGSVIASSLGDEDPELNPKYAKLSDEEFDKIALKYNATRDVYGVTTLLSLTWSKNKLPYLTSIYEYITNKAEVYCDKAAELKQLLKNKNVALLVNERLVNMPALLIPPLHEQLPGDLEFTVE